MRGHSPRKKYKPHSVCFVPENSQELTTEGGLDVCLNFNYLKKVISPLLKSEINVALFIDPNIDLSSLSDSFKHKDWILKIKSNI